MRIYSTLSEIEQLNIYSVLYHVSPSLRVVLPVITRGLKTIHNYKHKLSRHERII